MDIEEIKRLVELMVDGELSELDVTDGEQSIHLKRGAMDAAPVMPAPAPQASTPEAAGPHPVQAEAEAVSETDDEGLVEIKSPMVGTFYSSPSPDSEAYVREGEEVAEDAVVCIVEAMKVMNEIKAECTGTVAEVCVENAQPVEFGQVLFKVAPA